MIKTQLLLLNSYKEIGGEFMKNNKCIRKKSILVMLLLLLCVTGCGRTGEEDSGCSAESGTF